MRTGLAVLMFLAMPVSAQNWVEYKERTDAIFCHDPRAIRVNGHLRLVWGLTNLKERTPQDGALSIRVLHEFNCKEERVRTMAFTMFTESMAGGRVIFNSDLPEQRSSFIPPGTIFDPLLKIVCAVKK